MSSTPMSTSGPSVPVIFALVVALCILCLGPVAVMLIHWLRRRSARKFELEARVKYDRKTRLSPTSSGFGKVPGDLQLPARVKIAASSRLRDSVLGTAIGQLSWPEAGKVKRTRLAPIQEDVVDIEATAGLKESADVADEADPETTMSFPEWVRPHLSEFREQAQKEWSIYIPGTGLVAAVSAQTATVVPEIVVHSPTDPELLPSADSLDSVYSEASIYSQDSWEGDLAEIFNVPLSPWTPELDASSESSSPDIDSPGLETPKCEFQHLPQLQATLSPAVSKADMSSEASFYWPHLPSFSAMEHLQVPPSTWNGPVAEEHETTTASFSAQPFILCSPTSSSTTTQSRRSTTVFGQSSSSATVGLGLKSGTSGTFSTSSSLSEALDLWAQELETDEPFAFRAASDSHSRGGYVDAGGRATRAHPVYGYGYL